MLWSVLFGTMFIAAAAGLIYLITRFHKFELFKRTAKEHRFLSWILAVVPVAALVVCLILAINAFSMIVVILHLIVAWLICDLIGFIVKKIRKKPWKYYYQGIAAILLTVIYLSFGWYYAHHIYQTNYEFVTGKDIGQESLRVVEIADLHLGITMDGEEFSEYTKQIEQVKPDLVVIVGDFVDDDTVKEDMVEACRAVGAIRTTYGVYFAYGNHDNGYFNYRNFTSQELRTELAKNNITILEDESVLINDSFYLIGRKDRSMRDRLEASALTAELDQSKYMILLDHQPNDYANETKANVDLVLSGHTHGGHLFPAGPIGLAIGANDRNYGTETREGTTFVVTSGMAGWGIPFKTGGAISEFVVIDIKRKG